MMTLYIDKVESHVWSGFIVVSEKGLCFVSHYTEDLSDVVAWQMKHYPESKLISDREKVAPYRKQFEEYLEGTRFEFDLPVDLIGTDFQKSVWDAMLQIPYGETASYLDLAQMIGRDYKSTRAVGGAVGRNSLSIIYPCHRIVGQDGSLTGYGGGLDNKIALLNHELEHAVELDQPN